MIKFENMAWSPDGRQIAFLAPGEAGAGRFDLYVVDVGGGLKVRLDGDMPADGIYQWRRVANP